LVIQSLLSPTISTLPLGRDGGFHAKRGINKKRMRRWDNKKKKRFEDVLDKFTNFY
jgi:hypothetical protein